MLKIAVSHNLFHASNRNNDRYVEKKSWCFMENKHNAYLHTTFLHFLEKIFVSVWHVGTFESNSNGFKNNLYSKKHHVFQEYFSIANVTRE